MRLRLALAVLPILFAAGCAQLANAPKVDPVTVSAETAAAVADRGVRTNALYKQFCPTGQIPEKSCMEWGDFYPMFKKNYATFYMAYKAAIAAGDADSTRGIAASLESLSDQLLIFYLTSQRGN